MSGKLTTSHTQHPLHEDKAGLHAQTSCLHSILLHADKGVHSFSYVPTILISEDEIRPRCSLCVNSHTLCDLLGKVLGNPLDL